MRKRSAFTFPSKSAGHRVMKSVTEDRNKNSAVIIKLHLQKVELEEKLEYAQGRLREQNELIEKLKNRR